MIEFLFNNWPLTWFMFMQLVLLGVISGFLAGLLGIGGGMLMVPWLTAMLNHLAPADIAFKMAIATSMSTIMLTSLSSVYAHHQQGKVRWDLVKGLVPGILIGAALVSLGLFSTIRGHWLGLLFAGFVSYSAFKMLNPTPTLTNRPIPNAKGLWWVGGWIGGLSGLVGAGGGFVSVPFMTGRGVVIHQAVATSAALGFPIAFANTLGYIGSGWSITNRPIGSLGYVWLPALLCIASVSVIMAPIGAQWAHRLPVQTLKRCFAYLLFALAGYMAYRALMSF